MQRKIKPWRASLIVTGIIGLLSALNASAAPPPPERLSEYQVKAAYLFNFARFVTWPETAGSKPGGPIRIGIFGEDPFGSSLDQTLEGKAIGNRPLVIERIDDPKALNDCHILFICQSEETDWPRVLSGIGTTPVLTVGDFEGFTARGGMIRFLIEEHKVRFEINPGAADRVGLKISSKLLGLAKIFKQQPLFQELR